MGLTTTNASLYIGVPLFTIAIALVVFAFKILSKVKSENKLPRWNAFQLPWDQWQVLATSWIIFSSFVFYGVTIPTIPSSGSQTPMNFIDFCPGYGLRKNVASWRIAVDSTTVFYWNELETVDSSGDSEFCMYFHIQSRSQDGCIHERIDVMLLM